MTREVSSAEWGRIYAHAWHDPEFAERLSTDPADAVRGLLGIEAGTAVRVHQIPPKPEDLTDQQLEDIRSGTSNALMAPYSC